MECSGSGKFVPNVRRSDVKGYCPVCSALVQLTERGGLHSVSHQGQPTNVVAFVGQPVRVHANRCIICGERAEMNASLGPTCSRHYDQGEGDGNY